MAQKKANEVPKFEGLNLWERLETSDPKFVKAITGKSYKGNSPHPTWLVKKMTETLGPVGHAFGWDVVHECYVEGTPHRIKTSETTAEVVRELMHELRIRFWTQDPDTKEIGHFESYGSTKAFYLTNAGKWVHDEDAAKKSLTDAITKAISQLGGAADIFLGRWDDNKYVSELKEKLGQDASNAITPPAAPRTKNTVEDDDEEVDF